MLVNFSVGNFLSFKDIQTLNLKPEALKEYDDNLHIPYLYNSDERLLKSVAIYGHNSYGKTNFLKAFQSLLHLVFNSFTLGQIQNKIDIEPFRLNTSTLNEPSYFEITFLIREKEYRYELVLSSERILKECLYYSESKIRENYLFERTAQNIKISKNWNKDSNNRIEQVVPFMKQHILFLSVLFSQEDIPIIDSINKWFSSILIIPDNYQNEFENAQKIYSDLTYRPLILKFIESADLGFTTIFDKIDKDRNRSIQLEKGIKKMWYDSEIKNFELYTNHHIYDTEHNIVDKVEFQLQKNESAGSIKYFIIVCLLSYAIKNSQLIWIDELDAKFDSSLLEMLVRSFHNPKINPINSQLIFTTHNTILLDKRLRRDQMVIVEKNEWGESSIKRIHSSKKPIRIGKSIEKEYRKGDLGGVSKKIKKDNGPSLFD